PRQGAASKSWLSEPSPQGRVELERPMRTTRPPAGDAPSSNATIYGETLSLSTYQPSGVPVPLASTRLVGSLFDLISPATRDGLSLPRAAVAVSTNTSTSKRSRGSDHPAKKSSSSGSKSPPTER